LIACGHPPAAVWRYTPRQADAYLKLASVRLKQEKAAALGIAALAVRGEADDVNKQVSDWAGAEYGDDD
jgi:hypothetical protein